MEDHKGWGDRVGWFDFDSRRIEGHMSNTPSVGDHIIAKMQSGKNGVFEIIKVDWCFEPQDQFFATVKDIGYEDEEECFFVNDQKEFDKLNKIWSKALQAAEPNDILEDGNDI